ncbi:hypothetical protein [Pontibacter sp. G13]|uniref:hypothetical protein n=1 Tax=Pontibacter sp. G13 TaxID=3074898 RepID=UPI002889E904|nr:hypothetical protein [Pontibacter sp. G13]WNJ19298.1 hypothetical protein RJD25_02300 [Pontibacter sp. G13]
MKSLQEKVLELYEDHQKTQIPLSEVEIRLALEANGLPATPQLIEFEQRYRGMKLYADIVAIEFGLIWDGGAPFDPTVAAVEYEAFDPEDGRDHQYLITCAHSEFYIQFGLDEHGRYYENGQLKFNTFWELLEWYVRGGR